MTWTTAPLITDGAIELRLLAPEDAAALYALINRDRHYLRRWQNWPDRIRSLGAMQDLIAQSRQKAANDLSLDLTIRFDGEIAGKIGLVYIDWAARRAEIGYWIRQDFQGRGIITRACRALVDYALGEMELRTIHIRCAVGNQRSRAIPERLGFVSDGLMPHKIMLHGHIHEEIRYTMTAANWYAGLIYHITSTAAWDAARLTPAYRAESLESDGFIHFSTKDQIVRVADAVYAGRDDLVLLCVNPERLHAELKYEPPDLSIPAAHYHGELFPHLYGALNVDSVVRVLAFPPGGDGRFSLPPELSG